MNIVDLFIFCGDIDFENHKLLGIGSNVNFSAIFQFSLSLVSDVLFSYYI